MILIEIVDSIILKIIYFLEYVEFGTSEQMVSLTYLFLLLIITVFILLLSEMVIKQSKKLFKKIR